MAGDKRTNAQRLEHRERIAALRLKAWTHPMIAREVGVSPATVKRELVIVEAEWREAAKESIDAIKARELAKLEDLEAQARKAWERSLLDYSRKVVSEKPGGREGGGKQDKSRSATVESGSQNGDPRFLRIILDCQERRAKILGTDAPVKNETIHIFSEIEAAQQRLKAKRDAIVERPEG